MNMRYPSKPKVIVNAWAIGIDSACWHDAESFIPERFACSSIEFNGTHLEYIPFGAGKRMCSGVAFGLAKIELPLARLLYHFDWELPGRMRPEDLDVTEGKNTRIWLLSLILLRLTTKYNRISQDNGDSKSEILSDGFGILA
ncbi:hypothetical protein SO802_022787 [Lithocarpus litseifolius]|uniref:Cytochrome P450 n=1 Tax=Lithocarpus litseifolius TaxID=425828 RepID=A0AAW2C4E8_9ROSI